MSKIIAFLKQKVFQVDGLQVSVGVLIVVGVVAFWFLFHRK
jgi:hypothetical protein